LKRVSSVSTVNIMKWTIRVRFSTWAEIYLFTIA